MAGPLLESGRKDWEYGVQNEEDRDEGGDEKRCVFSRSDDLSELMLYFDRVL